MFQKLIYMYLFWVCLYNYIIFLQIDWLDRDGKCYIFDVYGYYFEMDYGLEYGLIFFIIYIQIYDVYNVFDFVDKGYVGVKVGGVLNDCIFKFDFIEDFEDNKRN